jgi:hypothetical protein
VWAWIDGELFTLRRDASRQHPVGFTGPTELDDLKGASAGVRGTRFFDGGSLDARVGASLQQLAHAGASGARRNLAFTEVGVATRQEGDQRFATQRFALTAAYGTGPDTLATRSSFARGVATAALAMGNKGNAVRAEGTFGLVSSSASAFERFTVGGAAAAYVDDATLTQWVAMPALPFGVLRGQRYASYRISLGDEMFSPFFWSAAAGDSLRDWIRVVGVDAHLAVPPLPVLRLPSTDVRAGVGYTLDDPWRKRLRGYMAVRYRP